jgi:hypothetical protein
MKTTPPLTKPAGDSVQRLVRGRSILAAAIETGRPVTRLGILRTSCNPDAMAYFETMEDAHRKAFSKSFLVGASNAKHIDRHE